MTDITAASPDTQRAAAPAKPADDRPRIVLLQTQAEAAGAQEISRILDIGLTKRGYEVHNAYLYRRTNAFDDQPNVMFCATERPGDPVGLLKLAYRLYRYLRDLKPDAIVCFQHYGNIAGAVAARLAGVPYVIANRNGPAGVVPKWVWPIDRAFGTAGAFDRMVVNCKTVADEYVDYPAAYRKRVHRIDHGFEPKQSNATKADARAAFGLPADATLLGSVARLSPKKGHDRAIRLLPGTDWHLAVVGQGAEHDNLVALGQSLGVSDRLHFLGEVSTEGVAKFLRALDVFVFPTTMETFGLAGAEAAAAGVPVVATDLPVLEEVLAVDDEPAAVFVDTADTAAFAHAVRTVLDDEQLRNDICARGRALPKRYSLDGMVDQYASLIEELRAQRPKLKGA